MSNKAILTALFGAACLAVGLLLGRRPTPDPAAVRAQRDTIVIHDSARFATRDTIRLRERAKARVDTLVQTLTDTQIVVRATPAAAPETVTVAPVIVERIRVDSSLIAALRLGRARDSISILDRDKLIALLRPARRWGLDATIGYGCGRRECGPTINIGIGFRITR